MYKIILQVFATLCKRSLILLTSGMGGDGWAGNENTGGKEGDDHPRHKGRWGKHIIKIREY